MADQDNRPSVIIVGSSGLIGTRLVKRLAVSMRVFALDHTEPDGGVPDGAEFIRMDITSNDELRDALAAVRRKKGSPAASVIQLASYYDFSGAPSEKYDEITVRGTERVLHAARYLPAEQFIFASSMLVHGPKAPGDPIREDDPLEGAWPYPQSKIETEKVIRGQHGDLPAVILRIAGVYTDACESLPISRQIQRIYEGRKLASVYPGDTSHGQSFVHVDDVADAFERAVRKRAELPRDVVAILIGEPETYSYDRLQREIARRIQDEPDWETREISKTMAKSGAWLQEKVSGGRTSIKPWMIDHVDDHYELDIARARELLGWSPQHRLIDTLPKMIEGLEADPQAWYARQGLEPPARVAEESPR